MGELYGLLSDITILPIGAWLSRLNGSDWMGKRLIP